VEEKMKQTLRDNIVGLPYSLHDMHVTELVINGNDLIFKFMDGFEQNIVNGVLVKGEICFHEADLDSCFVYVLDFCGNEGSFTGHKYAFADFTAENKKIDFEIIDETYGYNSSKLAGWLWGGEEPKECILDLYHFGAMEYITEE